MTVSELTLYLLRHGQTEWAVSGQHTGRTDIPLTDEGRAQARQLHDVVAQLDFSAVLVSPLGRARETASLAGLGKQMTVCDELAEFDYGDYEGLTTKQIREKVPGWTLWTDRCQNGEILLWTDPCPNGETLQAAAERCRKVIASAHDTGGNVALVAHGHILRILAVTWLNLPATEGKHLMLDTGRVSILAHEHETPAIKMWNGHL
jgi:broad specificity phosphatase PhoE